MNLDNFVVRPKRAHVERFAKPEAWTVLDKDDLHELASEVAPLPLTSRPRRRRPSGLTS